MNTALGQAREVKAVTLRQGSRNSYPIYDNKTQKITGWRERAELRLESADFPALSKLTGELLSTLKMDSMDFAIADSTRKASEDALLKDAVAAFKARAQLATDAWAARVTKSSTELQHQWLSTTLRTRGDDDESRRDGFCTDAGSRGRYQPGQHERRRGDRSLAVTVSIHKNGAA